MVTADPLVEAFVEEWVEWKRLGVLPDPGDLLDQSVARFQAFTACELGQAKANEYTASKKAAPALPVVGSKTWPAT